MTDDKGAGEGPKGLKNALEEFLNEVCPFKTYPGEFNDDGRGKMLIRGFKRGYTEGRKAERERCLAVLKKYPDDGKALGDILEAIRLEIKGLI